MSSKPTAVYLKINYIMRETNLEKYTWTIKFPCMVIDRSQLIVAGECLLHFLVWKAWEPWKQGVLVWLHKINGILAPRVNKFRASLYFAALYILRYALMQHDYNNIQADGVEFPLIDSSNYRLEVLHAAGSEDISLQIWLESSSNREGSSSYRVPDLSRAPWEFQSLEVLQRTTVRWFMAGCGYGRCPKIHLWEPQFKHSSGMEAPFASNIFLRNLKENEFPSGVSSTAAHRPAVKASNSLRGHFDPKFKNQVLGRGQPVSRPVAVDNP